MGILCCMNRLVLITRKPASLLRIYQTFPKGLSIAYVRRYFINRKPVNHLALLKVKLQMLVRVLSKAFQNIEIMFFVFIHEKFRLFDVSDVASSIF